MEREGKKSGRAQIYDGSMSDLAQRMESRRGTDHDAAEKNHPEKAADVRRDAGGGTVQERLIPSAKRKREQDNIMKMRALGAVLGILILILAGALIYEVVLGHGTTKTRNERIAEQQRAERRAALESEKQAKKLKKLKKRKAAGNSENGDAAQGEEEDTQTEALSAEELLARARQKAVQYDYDGAIDLLRSADGYEGNGEYQAAVDEFEQQRDACVPYPASDVTHVFFHTLIHDAGKAFDGDEDQERYDQEMVTESEFNSIIQQMYDRGYVMVLLDEIVPETEDSNGNPVFAERDIMLPSDKIPFVLSQGDVNYYHYMDGDGFASRLIVDENGDVKCEYIEEDGSVSVGDYDLVPLIDRFVEQHPDFSYHGQKGCIALTGYEGILGYRTDEVYKTKQQDRVTAFQQQFFDSYPGGFDEAAFERECAEAKKVAEAMKANGWKFASHTWGHQNLNESNGIAYDKFMRDTDRWEEWVEPLIGETDTLIYPSGGDIRGSGTYAGDRFNYLKEKGFRYFCGVDSVQHWMQVGTDYVRQTRRNINGYQMYSNPVRLSDLFDVSEAWDPLRPAPLPQSGDAG